MELGYAMLRRVFFVVFPLRLASAAFAERRVALVLGVEDYKLIRKLTIRMMRARSKTC
jgi:hypothetical protein